MTNIEQKPERLHALDAVRGYALLLGIVLHATVSFIPAPSRVWIIQDSQPSITLGVLFFSIHVFRMTTFFLIAGFFAHLSFHRRGAWGFIKDRLQRIALPLVVGWPILFTAMAMVVIWAASFPNGGPLPGPPRWPPVLPQFPLSHLWFLYVLLEFVWCCASAWSARPKRPHPPRGCPSPDRPGDAKPARSGDPGRADQDRVEPRSDMDRLAQCERLTHPRHQPSSARSASARHSALAGCCTARWI
jgi:hypothetical protein